MVGVWQCREQNTWMKGAVGRFACSALVKGPGGKWLARGQMADPVGCKLWSRASLRDVSLLLLDAEIFAVVSSQDLQAL